MWKQLFYTQLLCIFLVIFGIIIEFIYNADVGFLSITIGSLLFALTTKIENYYLTKGSGTHLKKKGKTL